VCDAVEGRFLQAGGVAELRAACRQAEAEGAGAVFVRDAQIGDAAVLVAGLGAGPELLLGVCADLEAETHRHPTLLAREMTTLDHLSRGRSMLVFAPGGDGLREALLLCRAMWREGIAVSQGPCYPVPGAVNRPRPPQAGSPRLALDLTDGSTAAPDLVGLVDFVLLPDARPGACQVQPA